MISNKSLLVIISSLKTTVEKGTKGNKYNNKRYESPNDSKENTETSSTILQSTGKGAKKRRSAIVTEDESEVEDEEKEAD